MICIKVIFEDDNHLFTHINATLEEAKKYYLNNTFTVANKRVKGKEVIQVRPCPSLNCDGNITEIRPKLWACDKCNFKTRELGCIC